PSLSLSPSLSPCLCHPLPLSPYGVFRPPPPTCQHLPIRSVLFFHPSRVCSSMLYPPSVCQAVSHRLYVCVCLCPTLCLCPCLCHPLSHCLSVCLTPCCVLRQKGN